MFDSVVVKEEKMVSARSMSVKIAAVGASLLSLALSIGMCVFGFTRIFFLILEENDQSAITSSLSSCQPSVCHPKVGESSVKQGSCE